MEVKDTERMVVVRPVPSRPRSDFNSFSELLAGAMDASPSSSFDDTTVAIKPKTVRLRPFINYYSAEIVLPPESNPRVQSSDKTSARTSKVDHQSGVLYKPTPKVISRSTASHLANMGNFGVVRREMSVEMQAQFHVADRTKHNFQTPPAVSFHQNFPTNLDDSENREPSGPVLSIEKDTRIQQPSNSGDRSSYDGYNWRKYGQKQVKGSEYPRSYYKCTHPSCPVKKKVERSLDGQIAEIVYKGEHNHSKPQPPKRLSSVSQGQHLVPDGNGRDIGILSWTNTVIERNDRPFEMQNEVGFSVNPIYPGRMQFTYDPLVATTYLGAGNIDTPGAPLGDCEAGSSATDAEHDRPDCKRRKKENRFSGAIGTIQDALDPPSFFQTSNESDVSGDGFRWRKYGQKVVKGNSYPRSYYRCTSLECNMRKYVERALDDPNSFITTYEGKHNHKMIQSQVASEPDTLALNKSSNNLFTLRN